jgi:hypothetical protein
MSDTRSEVEVMAMADCGVRRAVPAHWSDWWAHAAMVLAVLYDWRGRESGKTVRQWLQSVVDEGHMEEHIKRYTKEGG